MAYLIDSSSLIEAKDRIFCFDVCPGYWDWLEQQNAAGNVFSIDRVFDELSKGNDALAAWIKPRASFFLASDAPTMVAMAQVASWTMAEDFRPQAKSEFLGVADSFLVAFALAHGHTVVTEETLVIGEKKRVKIPVACKAFNIPCITPMDMLRTEGVRFVLALP